MSPKSSIQIGTAGAEGRPGKAVKIDPEWVGWRGTIAHPDSPAGGGGPGHFSRVRLARREPGALPSPWRRGPLHSIGLQGAQAPRPANPAPATNPRSLGVLKSVQSDLMDVNVDAKIIADGAGADQPAVTTPTRVPAWTLPTYIQDSHYKIVKFNGKFIWRDTVTIQTVYAIGVGPNDLSGYGRGTTPRDVTDGNITLGFHESCHREDYVRYLRMHPLPDPPPLAIGMTVPAYNKARATFDKALNAYFDAMEAESTINTDEKGYTKSAFLRTGRVFEHKVP